MAASELSVDEIHQALMGRYPITEHVHVHEAPMGPDRGGRKLDALIICTWKTRGYHRIGVEIKRSIGDFRTELANPEKSDWWCEHLHQFWVAAPANVARRIELDCRLPLTWGLMSVSGAGIRSVKAARVNKKPQDLPWETLIGCMRAAQNSGAAALQRRYDEGRRDGQRAAESAHAAREATRNKDWFTEHVFDQLERTAQTLDETAAQVRRHIEFTRRAAAEGELPT